MTPLTVPAAAIRSVDDATTRGQKRSDAINSVLGTLIGGQMRQSKKSYIVTVDPATFRRDVGGAIGAVEDALAAQAVESINAAR